MLSDRQAMMDERKHQLKELSQQEHALRIVIAQKRSLLANLEISSSSERCEESRQVNSDIANAEAKYESFAFKKALEERTTMWSGKTGLSYKMSYRQSM